eukprot:SAG31_NODE_2159_length_6302_cov_9.311140_2_plen_135_part_00
MRHVRVEMRAQEMGKWGRNKREEAYRLALAGGGTRSSGERALYAFGKGCPPYICVQGIRGLAPTWWDGVQTAEAISFGRAGGSVVPPTESADGAVVRPAVRDTFAERSDFFACCFNIIVGDGLVRLAIAMLFHR